MENTTKISTMDNVSDCAICRHKVVFKILIVIAAIITVICRCDEMIKTSTDNADDLKSSKFRFTGFHILYAKLRPQ
jgi:hypothetical protein